MREAVRAAAPAAVQKAALAVVLIPLAVGVGRTAFADYVVLKSQAADHQVGELLEEGAALEVAEGEHLVLLSDNGDVVEVRGPYRGVPKGERAREVDVKDALTHLIANADPVYTSLGSTRGGVTREEVPAARDAWHLDPFTTGDQCVVEGDNPFFWRALTDEALSLVMQRPGRDGNGNVSWPPGEAVAAWPESMPLVDGELYVLRRPGYMENAMLRIVVLPKDVTTSLPTAVAWLAINGCKTQAQMLLAEMP